MYTVLCRLLVLGLCLLFMASLAFAGGTDEAPTAPKASSCLDGEWKVTFVQSSADSGGKPPDFTLDTAKKTITGFSGCNRFFGSFSVKPGTLVFSQMGSTRMMCENAQFEFDFLSAMEQVAAYQCANNKLTLSDKAGQAFVAAER